MKALAAAKQKKVLKVGKTIFKTVDAALTRRGWVRFLQAPATVKSRLPGFISREALCYLLLLVVCPRSSLTVAVSIIPASFNNAPIVCRIPLGEGRSLSGSRRANDQLWMDYKAGLYPLS